MTKSEAIANGLCHYCHMEPSRKGRGSLCQQCVDECTASDVAEEQIRACRDPAARARLKADLAKIDQRIADRSARRRSRMSFPIGYDPPSPDRDEACPVPLRRPTPRWSVALDPRTPLVGARKPFIPPSAPYDDLESVHRDIGPTLRRLALEPLAFTARDLNRSWRAGLVAGIGAAAMAMAGALAAVCAGAL